MRFRHWLTGEIMGQRYAAGSQAGTIADPAPAKRARSNRGAPQPRPRSDDAFETANAHIIYRGVESLKLLSG